MPSSLNRPRSGGLSETDRDKDDVLIAPDSVCCCSVRRDGVSSAAGTHALARQSPEKRRGRSLQRKQGS